MNNFSEVSDKELLSRTEQLASNDRWATAELLFHLMEVEQRKLHLGLGYSSLYAYTTDKLRYSRPGAHRRISSARCITKYPEVYSLLLAGELNITTISMIYGVMNDENRTELIEKARNTSVDKVKALIATYRPRAKVRESVKPVSVFKKSESAKGGQAGKSTQRVESLELFGASKAPAPVKPEEESECSQQFELKYAVSQKLMGKIDRAKNLLSNTVKGEVSLEKLMDVALEHLLEKRCPRRRQERRDKRALAKQKGVKKAKITPEKSPSKGSVPAETADLVYIQAGGQCTYVGEDKVRCCRKSKLTIEHMRARARGGDESMPNLTLYCSYHNQYSADKVFGREFMDKHRYG